MKELVFGGLIILFIIFEPEGIVGDLDQVEGLFPDLAAALYLGMSVKDPFVKLSQFFL